MPGVALCHPNPLHWGWPRRVQSMVHIRTPSPESDASTHLLSVLNPAENCHRFSMDHYIRPSFGMNLQVAFAGPVDRIIVVDNDSEIVDVTRIDLEAGGYQVVPAHSGEEALKKVPSTQPDLNLLDISMPGIYAEKILKVPKIDEKTSELPVAKFSIKLEVRDKVLGLEEGTFDYITKSFACDELLDRVGWIFHQLSAGEGG